MVLEELAHNGRALVYASEELKNDKEGVLAAVAAAGRALQYASPALRRDKEVLLVAVAKAGHALSFASEHLRGDKEVVLVAVEQTGDVLHHASEAYDGRALACASKQLRGDKEVMLAAVAQTGCLLRGLPNELKMGGLVLYAQEGLRVHDSFMFFLLAARPLPDQADAKPIHLISALGDDDASAGAVVKRVIAAFMGAPCGKARTNRVRAGAGLSYPSKRRHFIVGD